VRAVFPVQQGKRRFPYNCRKTQGVISCEDDYVRFHNISADEFEGFWAEYFDLNRDYGAIIGDLAERDFVLREAAAFAPGIRIMNQDPWETLLCFIISANNRIPMIMKVVGNIAERFGEDNVLPGPEILAKAALDGLLACKAGFRAGYIINAAESVLSGNPILDADREISTDELRRRLMTIKGVGVKVADCVMLFGMGRREVFPVDVWIGRAVRRLYFNGADVPLAQIQAFARERFGEHAGYANQLLFHYARMNRII